jgi:putative IMPACT (imprinted ancient) family translation regulator
MSAVQLYRICWSQSNGHSGHGEKILTLEAAQAWIIRLREKHPDMTHWLSST